MPRDSNGIMTLPASTWVQTGDTVLPVQHNPPFRDIENALTNSIDRDGRTVMTGNLQMGGNKVTGLGDPSLPGDAMTRRVSGIEFETRSHAEAWAGTPSMPDSIVIRGDASVDDGLGGTFVRGHPSSDTMAVAGESYGRVGDISPIRLSKFAGLRSPLPVNLQTVNQQSFVRYITRSVEYLGNQTQGAAWDEVNRYFYEMRVFGGMGSISRYRMDGPIAQLSYDSMNGSPLIGHQSLGVQNFSDGSVKLWAPSAIDGDVIRFTYNPGGDPIGVESFSLFNEGDGQVTMCISHDQRYLVARVPQAAGNYVRVFLLEGISPGDLRGQQVYEWRIPDRAKPVQDIASDGEFVVVGRSAATTSEKIELQTFDIRTGDLCDESFDVVVGLDDAESSGLPGQGGLTFYELEALSFSKMERSGGPRLFMNTIGGDTSRRRTLYHIIDLGDRAYADERADILLRRMDEFSPSSQRRQLMRETFSEYERYGLLEGLFSLWVLAANSLGADLINWIDPGENDLVRFGTGTGFQADIGIQGNGTDRFLGIDKTYMNLVNYERDRAHIAVCCTPGVDGAGAAIGVDSGVYVRIDPRTTNGSITTRLNSNAGLDEAEGEALTTSGILSVDRNSNTGGSYDLWRGDSKLKTVLMPMTTGNNSTHLVRVGKSDSNYFSSDMTIHIVELRRPLTDQQILSRNRIWKNYMSELGTTLVI